MDDSHKDEYVNCNEVEQDACQSPAAKERALLWKQDLRIIPLCAIIMTLSYIDRGNIGNARVLNANTHNDLLTETHMSNYQFVITLTVFYIGYLFFEVPANILLKRLRPRRWIAIITFWWSAVTIAIGGTRTFAQVAVLRFFLGVADSCLVPGFVFYLTFWYRASERSSRTALVFATAATLAGVFGGLIAYAIGHMNGANGLSAWRWLFILEGTGSCIFSLAVWYLLPDFPENSPWLSMEELELAQERLGVEGSKGSAAGLGWEDIKTTLTNWPLYGHWLMAFTLGTPFSSQTLFMPTLTTSLGYTNLQAQLMTVPPNAVACAVSLVVAWSADRFNARGAHVAIFSLLGAIGFITSALLPSEAYLQRYGCLILTLTGTFACIPPALCWIASNVASSTAAVGFALAVNSITTSPGQLLGTWIYKANEEKIGYPTGNWTNAAMLLTTTLTSVLLTFHYTRANRRNAGLADTKPRGRVYIIFMLYLQAREFWTFLNRCYLPPRLLRRHQTEMNCATCNKSRLPTKPNPTPSDSETTQSL